MTLPRAVAHVTRADHAHSPRPTTTSPLPPPTQWCRCFVCKHPTPIPLPLSADQPNWVECDHCGLDNEIPAWNVEGRLIEGRVPTRFF
jgi:hypothetical protein